MPDYRQGPVTIPRADLYARVWSIPMQHLAPEFGLSDVGLAKVCRRHGIPRPPRGHWTRVLLGLPVGQPPLGAVSDPALETVTIQPTWPRDPSRVPMALTPLGTPANPSPEIVVPEVVGRFHPLVAATRRQLQSGHWRQAELVIASGPGSLSVAVGRANIPRAMRILHALITALEARGHQVQSGGETSYRRLTVAHIDGEAIEWQLRERLKQTRTKDAPDRQRREAERFGHAYVQLPSGQLVLDIATYSWCGIRRRFADGAKQRLEGCLGEVVAAMLALAAEAKARQRQHDEERQQRLEEERRLAEEQRRRQEEAERLRGLCAEADAWHQAAQIRAYLAAVRDAAVGAQVPLADDSELGRWLIWAEDRVARLDPLAARATPITR